MISTVQREGTFLTRAPDVPVGLCQCGCGLQTRLAPKSSARLGVKAGEPYRFIQGHGGQRGRDSVPLADRFWDRVDQGPSDGCWNWTGPLASSGYGHAQERKTDHLAHRFAYELAKGEIPSGLVVRHTCDNKRCCNPAHLLTGTARDNSRDSVERGLVALGERVASAVLTEEDVRDLRRARAAGVTVSHLARQYGVARTTIRHAALGKTWGHVR